MKSKQKIASLGNVWKVLDLLIPTDVCFYGTTEHIRQGRYVVIFGLKIKRLLGYHFHEKVGLVREGHTLSYLFSIQPPITSAETKPYILSAA